ncbi:YwbE family protein (plasmid) [Aneurinibacillus sp. Ricciae_BoGa-3]|uniref:YwbE family protein n=1 Tax=Aneurinibacillus sp. Ricciae_BoGa-3 TaxID=3022697 RepID=UPI0023421433|nr:YwbE family protein [Aneurinibacillus sp. Ricciae_BoGa-3]WCK57146.1 YwbE family protein [Aneurinibacillus sp. Ricciae_BoGa-3]
MAGEYRNELYYGMTVEIVLKQDQRTGVLTRGKIKDILTNKSFHSRGIKVRLQNPLDDGTIVTDDKERVGRIVNIIL